MKRFSLILLACLCFSASFAQIDYMRNLFFNATDDAGIKSFYEAAKKFDESIPIQKAYKGVAIAMCASVANSISEKIDYFNQGKDLIENAVISDWYNAEIRFLRFSVQVEVPGILGYSGQTDEDAYVLIDALEKNYINHQQDFWKKAISFMVQSDELNKDQIVRIKRYI